jgi:hypothetical protein
MASLFRNPYKVSGPTVAWRYSLPVTVHSGKAKPPKGLEREDMDGWFWALVFKGLVLAVMLAIAYPFKWAVQRWMPDCKLKRILLFSWAA